MAGQSFAITAVGARLSFHSSSQRRNQASIQIPIWGLPSVQDFKGDLVSMCIAKDRSRAVLVMWFQDLLVSAVSGRRVQYALLMVESGLRQKTKSMMRPGRLLLLRAEGSIRADCLVMIRVDHQLIGTVDGGQTDTE
jgi:hypothetical protein